MMFFHQLDYDRQRDDEWSIYAWRNIDGIAVTEDGELATDACEQITVVITYTEVPLPDIAIDVEYHAIAALDFERFNEQAELFVHAGPMLPIAINLIMWQERNNTLLDMDYFLPSVKIIHHKVIANMKEFSPYLEDGITGIIANEKSFGKGPGTLSEMVTHFKHSPFVIRVVLEIALN
jgi:hypothetical protein